MVGVGGQAEGGSPCCYATNSGTVFSVGDRDVHNLQIGRERYWQQFGTPPTLISTPQWVHRPYNAPMWFYRVRQKPSVKADLAIYSHALDVFGQCKSVSVILGFKLDFSS